jgi:hypothetical protein
MTLKERYKNVEPVGVYVLCNYGGLVILDMDDDRATVAYDFGEGYKQIRRHNIYYTYTGRAYIRKGGTRYYFDQIMRTEGRA